MLSDTTLCVWKYGCVAHTSRIFHWRELNARDRDDLRWSGRTKKSQHLSLGHEFQPLGHKKRSPTLAVQMLYVLQQSASWTPGALVQRRWAVVWDAKDLPPKCEQPQTSGPQWLRVSGADELAALLVPSDWTIEHAWNEVQSKLKQVPAFAHYSILVTPYVSWEALEMWKQCVESSLCNVRLLIERAPVDVINRTADEEVENLVLHTAGQIPFDVSVMRLVTPDVHRRLVEHEQFRVHVRISSPDLYVVTVTVVPENPQTGVVEWLKAHKREGMLNLRTWPALRQSLEDPAFVKDLQTRWPDRTIYVRDSCWICKVPSCAKEW